MVFGNQYAARRGNAVLDLAIYALVLACTGVVFWGIWTAALAVLVERPEIDSAGAVTGIAAILAAIAVMQVSCGRMSDVAGD